MSPTTKTTAGAIEPERPKRTSAIATDADGLPLLCDTAYLGKILGCGPTYAARLCQQGRIPTATKVGKSWRINPREALRAMGLLHDQEA